MGMSQQIINVGSSPNDGAGDPIRAAFIKANSNFTQLFALPNPTPPTTLVGKTGDVPGMYAYNSNYFYYCFGTYNGTTVIWAQVSQTDNLSVANIVNGTSNVKIASANANVAISVNSVSNVAVFSTSGASLSGNVSALNMYANGVIIANSNITGANLKTQGSVSAVGNVYGNTIAGTYLTGDGSNISNITAAGSNTQIQFNDNGRIGALASLTYNSATSLLSLTGNIKTVGAISATGNITASYFIGNVVGNISGNIVVPGANRQVLFNDDGNAGAVASFTYDYANSLLSLTGNIKTVGSISTTGNITAGYYIGNGSQLTGLPLIYGNSNVANFLPVFTGNIKGNFITATGNIHGNIVVGNYIYGDGSNISNISANFGNANVANYLPTYTGNLTANNITTTGYVSAVGVVRGNNFNTSGVITATGNISTASYFIGNLIGNVSGNISGNFVVPGANTQVLYNNSGNAGASAGMTFNSASNILSVSGNIVAAGTLTTSGTFRLPSYTTSQISNLSAVEGDMVYNSDLKKIQGYQANATNSVTWVSLSVSTYQ